VIELILRHATFKDVPYTPDEGEQTTALDLAAGGGDAAEIPQARHAGEQQPLPTQAQRP
jgi:hypothetical protein